MQEELDEADMVRVYRILNGNDKVDKKMFWTMEEAREGAGTRRFGNTLFWRWTLKFDHSLLGSPRILEYFEDDGSDE